MFKYFIIVFIGMSVIFNDGYAEIIVKLSLDKHEYLEAEAIILKVSFFNNSSTIDSIKYFPIEESYSYLNLTSSDNREILVSFFTSDFIKVPYRKIKPHEELTRTFDLLDYRYDVRIRYSRLGKRAYLSSGNFSLLYDYNSILKSNEIEFSISKPAGTELQVFNILMEAYQIKDISFTNIDSILLKKDLYYEIAENNENSVYWEEAVYYYNKVSKWLKSDSINVDINKKFVDKYPNSYFLPLVFKKLCKAIYLYEGGEPEVEKYLDYLMFKHQNSNIYTMASDEKTRKTYLK